MHVELVPTHSKHSSSSHLRHTASWRSEAKVPGRHSFLHVLDVSIGSSIKNPIVQNVQP